MAPAPSWLQELLGSFKFGPNTHALSWAKGRARDILGAVDENSAPNGRLRATEDRCDATRPRSNEYSWPPSLFRSMK